MARKSVTYRTSKARKNTPLSNRAGEISTAFAHAARQFLKDEKISYDDIQRVRFSIKVDTETPDISYPLAKLSTRPSQDRFFEEMEASVLYFLLFHDMKWSRSSRVYAELQMDDKTPKMAKPQKTLALTLEGA
ncbi:MAG: hypothetical protein GC136_05705 [Alphaproteobacteria bacterium]|nr:hypothetical protein [Alphaproteobacteria bacterium]